MSDAIDILARDIELRAQETMRGMRALAARREEHIKTQLREMGLPLDPKRLAKAVHRRWPGKIMVQEYRRGGPDLPTLRLMGKREFKAALLAMKNQRHE